MAQYALYHGNEEWVLKGIAVDLERSLRALGLSTVRSDAFKEPWASAEFHLFVQQGQLLRHVQREGPKHLSNSVCLYTHYDRNQCSPKILNQTRALIFNSSIQLATAVANGIDPSICHLFHYGVDHTFHRPLRDLRSRDVVVNSLGIDSWSTYYGNAVGFCGRYWNKPSYTRRKNYNLILDLVKLLVNNKTPIIFLGSGWENLLPKDYLSKDFIRIVKTDYKFYPLIYNAMKVLVSPSLYESGPFPVLEAMSCGIYPITSATGFCPDIITSDLFGKVLPLSASASDYFVYINQQLSSSVDNSNHLHLNASKYSFDNLAHFIFSL